MLMKEKNLFRKIVVREKNVFSRLTTTTTTTLIMIMVIIMIMIMIMIMIIIIIMRRSWKRYQDLALKIKRIHRAMKVTVIPIVIGPLETISKLQKPGVGG